jgi:hypothetical protein
MSKSRSTSRSYPRARGRGTIVVATGLGALALAGAGQAVAEDINDTRPPTRYAMPGAVLHVNPSFFDEGTDATFTFRVVQTSRRIKRGTLSITLPAAFRERSPAGGPTRARIPLTGTGSSSRVKVRRIGRVLRFSFTNGRRNDHGRYTVTDRTLPEATYRSSFKWRVDGYEAASGNLSVLVLPVPQFTPVP